MITAIIDVDGVLLNWWEPFNAWLKSMNLDINNIDNDLYVKLFNESVHIGRLPPYESSLGIKKLHEQGYELKICSAFSDNLLSHELRKQNLINVYGDIFSEYKFLPVGHSKAEYIKEQLTRNDDLILFEDNMDVILDVYFNTDIESKNIYFVEHSYTKVTPERLRKLSDKYKTYLMDYKKENYVNFLGTGFVNVIDMSKSDKIFYI